jgi:hypothetical protein
MAMEQVQLMSGSVYSSPGLVDVVRDYERGQFLTLIG